MNEVLYDVCICDEIDRLLEPEALVDIRQAPRSELAAALGTGVYGLAVTAYSKRNYLMSATLSDYNWKLARDLFQIQDPDVTKFENLQTFVARDGTTYRACTLESVQKPDDSTLLDALVKYVKDRVRSEPLFLFSEVKLKKKALTRFYDAVKHLNPALPYYHIKDEASAGKARDKYMHATSGLFVLERHFGHGYNLKLGRRATVLILRNGGMQGEPVGHSEVLQMAGRGSRAQEQGHAVLFMVNPE